MIPVDSAEAQELRDRELDDVPLWPIKASRATIPDRPTLLAIHLRDCVGGWLGEDDQGRPIPCLLCHPRLRRAVTAAHLDRPLETATSTTSATRPPGRRGGGHG